jgi:hypothetical protein
MLRLPLTVAPVFLEWLERCYPDRAARIVGRIRGVRGGRLNSPDFGDRMTGGGEIARQTAGLFKTFASRHGLDGGIPPLDASRSASRGRPAGNCGCSRRRARIAL